MKTRNTIVRAGLAAAAAAGLLLSAPVLAEDMGSGSAMEQGQAQGGEEIAAQVRDKLQQKDELRQVEVESEGDQITLKGEVEESSQRAEAEELARSVPGVSQIQNEIEVARRGSTGGSPGMEY